MNSVLFICRDKSAECLKRGLSWKGWGFQQKTCSCLKCLIHFHGRRSWKQRRSRADVLTASTKADTSGTFDKSELYFWYFDGDCQQPPRAQIYLLVLRGTLTETFSLKSQRCSVAHANVSVTAYFIWGVSSAAVVREYSQQPRTTDRDRRRERAAARTPARDRLAYK